MIFATPRERRSILAAVLPFTQHPVGKIYRQGSRSVSVQSGFMRELCFARGAVSSFLPRFRKGAVSLIFASTITGSDTWEENKKTAYPVGENRPHNLKGSRVAPYV